MFVCLFVCLSVRSLLLDDNNRRTGFWKWGWAGLEFFPLLFFFGFGVRWPSDF